MTVDKNDPRIARLLEEVKEREALGYAYEGADASFELLARRIIGKVPERTVRPPAERRVKTAGSGRTESVKERK